MGDWVRKSNVLLLQGGSGQLPRRPIQGLVLEAENCQAEEERKSSGEVALFCCLHHSCGQSHTS